MINKRFEAYKLKRELKRSGTDFTFNRFTTNKFGEKNLDLEVVGELKGLYHEENSNLQLVGSDPANIITKKLPMILCLYEDVKELNLKIDDIVIINEKTFKVVGFINIQEWSIIADISLELFKNDGVEE